MDKSGDYLGFLPFATGSGVHVFGACGSDQILGVTLLYVQILPVLYVPIHRAQMSCSSRAWQRRVRVATRVHRGTYRTGRTRFWY